MITLLLVDDHPAARDALRMRLELEPDLTVVGEAHDGSTALVLAEQLAPDVVLMDLALPGMNGIEATTALRRRAPASAVVVFTLYDNIRNWSDAQAAGAAACIGKQEPAEVLLRAIRRATADGRAARHR
jgi:DNA-binding NarL/FixJ family response regulator